MCGINFYLNKDFQNTVLKTDIEQMNLAIAHRGPDADGIFTHNNFGLGHRRLSIIDLSTAANQPMHSACGRYVIAFNGEVYNYQEIAKDLGLSTKTTSDTEVVLESFVKEGVGAINRFNGMFVCVITEIETGKTFILRDRLGVKPLFIYQDHQRIALSSELKGLTAHDNIKSNCSINHEAIPQFLHFGFIPEPQTIYNEIQKFPTGSYAIIENGEITYTRYWGLEEQFNKPILQISEQEAIEQINEILNDSIKLRLRSDVPFGTFLSGGIDSSLVTALAQKHSSNPINTFCIKFNEQKYDESMFARDIAGYLGTNHHEFTVTHKDAMDLLPKLMDIYDEPYTDTSALPSLLVSKLAKQHVTMTLSGDGGDELFMGYGAYHWAKRLSKYNTLGINNMASLLLSMGKSRHQRAAKVFDVPSNEPLSHHIFSQEQYLFSSKELQRIKKDIPQYKQNKQSSVLRDQSFFDFNYYLKDDLLVKADRASMWHALEVRQPLLDYRLVELAIQLPDSMKIKENQNKYILKKVLYNHIPASYFDRPKWGFSIPLDQWLAGPLHYIIEEYALDKNMLSTFNIDESGVKDLVKRFKSGQTYLYNRIWALVVLGMWVKNCKL